MRLKSYVKLLGLIAACFGACAQIAPSDAKELAGYIDKKGAKPVVKELTSGKGTAWQAVIRKIDQGSTEWLTVAAKLRTGTDAGNTEDLRVALAIALTHNAVGVLSMLGPNLTPTEVCTVPFIEPDANTVRMHKMRVREALQKVSSDRLASKKKDCLANLSK